MKILVVVVLGIAVLMVWWTRNPFLPGVETQAASSSAAPAFSFLGNDSSMRGPFTISGGQYRIDYRVQSVGSAGCSFYATAQAQSGSQRITLGSTTLPVAIPNLDPEVLRNLSPISQSLARADVGLAKNLSSTVSIPSGTYYVDVSGPGCQWDVTATRM